jgi:cytochrome c
MTNCFYAKLASAMLALSAAVFPALAQGSAEFGREEFESKCAKCHSVEAEAGPGTGPNLHGIVGAKAGVQPNFVFSDAMKYSGLLWSEESLAKFLENPATVIPGNRMAASFSGTSADIAADIAAYLKTK